MQNWMCDTSGGFLGGHHRNRLSRFSVDKFQQTERLITVVRRVPLGTIDCNLGAKPR